MKIKKLIGGIIVIVVIFGAVFVFSNKNKNGVSYTFAKVEKGDIIQTVSETGTVKSDSEINLGFLGSGKLEKKHYAIGDKVLAGEVIAELDYGRLEISKTEAQANLDSARESLNKLLAGATYEEKAITQAGFNQAKASYESAKKELDKTKLVVEENISQAQSNLDKLETEDGEVTALKQSVVLAETNLNNAKATYQKAVDDSKDSALVTSEDKIAVSNTALDILDGILDNDDLEYLIGVKDKGSYDDSKNLYDDSIDLLIVASGDLNNAKTNPTNENVLLAVNSAIGLQSKVFEALQKTYYALENSITSANFLQSELDALKASVSAQQTLISSGISILQSKKQALENAIIAYNTNVSSLQESLIQAQASLDDAVRSARDALSTAKITGDQQITSAESRVETALEAQRMAQAELDRILATANKHDVSLAKTKITQAESAIKSIEKQIEDSIIRAPIDGMITKFNYEIGEQVSGGTVVSMLGENNLEIEVLISEADIAKVNKDDQAEITLDSFGDDVKFSGVVEFIEPAETEIQDVIYYKVIIKFEPGEIDVKSGMTANVTIVTDTKNDVLIMPSRAVVDRNGHGKFVRYLDVNKNMLEKQIQVGLRGDEGMIELISGVSEGEQVITYVKEEK